MSTIPREWIRSIAGAFGGTQASIVLPASTTGVAYVLTGLHAKLIGNGNAAAFAPVVQVLDGATVIFSYLLGIGAAGATVITADTFDDDALHLVGTAGNTMTAQISSPPPVGVAQSLSCKGYLL